MRNWKIKQIWFSASGVIQWDSTDVQPFYKPPLMIKWCSSKLVFKSRDQVWYTCGGFQHIQTREPEKGSRKHPTIETEATLVLLALLQAIVCMLTAIIPSNTCPKHPINVTTPEDTKKPLHPKTNKGEWKSLEQNHFFQLCPIIQWLHHHMQWFPLHILWKLFEV